MSKNSSNRQRYTRKSYCQYDPWQLLVSGGGIDGNGSSTNIHLTTKSNRRLKSIIKNVSEIEIWIDRLLGAPYPKEMEASVELEVFPWNNLVLTFALPDKQRLSLCDFPLHLPLELLGVSRCLQASIC